MDENVTKLLEDWYVRIRAIQRSHFEEANVLKRRNHFLGIPVVILSAIVGTTIFASLSEAAPSPWIKIAVGMISVSAAVLASLQTFLNYSEKSALHLQAATKLSSLKKEIEERLALSTIIDGDAAEYVVAVRQKWETITHEAPLLSQKIFEKNYSKFKVETAFPNNEKGESQT